MGSRVPSKRKSWIALIKKWRKRYIVFKCADWREAKRFLGRIGARLVYSHQGYGIARVKHLEKDRAINYLNQIGETIKTTGSIKKAKKILSTYRQPR